jgi:hypothetical protein
MPAADDLAVVDLVELGELLTADPSPLRSFSIDPSKLTLPGVWCRVDALAEENLRGLTIRTTLHLIVGEADWDRALSNLAPLWNGLKAQLREHGGSSGDSTLVGVILPGSQTPLPAVAVPFDFTTTQESE